MKVPFQLVSKVIVRVGVLLSVLGKAVVRVRVRGKKPMSCDLLMAIELVLSAEPRAHAPLDKQMSVEDRVVCMIK